ncbi:canopy family protein seele isoform X1 [Oratosquilla oratoria]|uniref:canopy family protein seele isoform X1 n=1 Tax=Oratosquilla oratoria TaxID=337810 RepID=UPI003F7693CE
MSTINATIQELSQAGKSPSEICRILKARVSRAGVYKALKCLKETGSTLPKVDSNRKVESGSFRIDSKGNQKPASKKYAGSELHMVEVLETVCKRFDDYAQAVHKTTGRLTVMQLVINGAMNPNFGDYELKQDSELNRSLEFYCNGMVEEYEEDITALYGENPEIGKKDLQKVLCNEMADLCSEQKEEL